MKHAEAITAILDSMDVKGPNDGRPVIFIGAQGPRYIGHAANTDQVNWLLAGNNLSAMRITKATVTGEIPAREFWVAHA